MRYVKGHGPQTKSRIVEHASYSLRQRGADGLSVVDLMKLVGLTHCGFYSHFASRDRTIAHWLKLMQEMPVEQRFDVIVDAYLSPAHRDDRARGCVLPSLSIDIARLSPKARHIFARKLGEMIDMLAALFPEQTPDEARRIATSVLATMMGAIVRARDRRRTTVRRHSCIRTADTTPSIHRRIGRRTDQHM
jgi:TetR/AcrR family transcriptional regulator, transcriptional repressor for nem operon